MRTALLLVLVLLLVPACKDDGSSEEDALVPQDTHTGTDVPEDTNTAEVFTPQDTAESDVTCSPNGASCASIACCEGTCSPSSQLCVGCLPDGQRCVDATDCCNATCTNGVCGSGAACTPGGCCKAGSLCTDDADCCNGSCLNGVCTVGCLTTSDCCPTGSPCASSGDCCSGNCNPQNFTCEADQQQCSGAGEACDIFFVCCSGFTCELGLCRPPGP